MRKGGWNAFLLPLIFVITVAEFLFDLTTPVGLSDWVIYFIPLTLSVFAGTRYFSYLLAGLFSVLIVAGLYLSPPGMNVNLALTGRSIGMMGLWILALLIAERKAMEAALKHTERALKTICDCNQALVRASSESALLHEICRIIVDRGGYRMAWVGFREEDEEKSVRVAAFAGCDEGYLEKSKITWADKERGRGPVGTCIRESRMVIVRNFQTDPNAIPWRKEALKRGFASSIALPLFEDKKVFAVLSIYAREVNAFSDEEIRLLNELAADLTYGIHSYRARLQQQEVEEALKMREQIFSSIVGQAADAIALVDADTGRFAEFNASAHEGLGYTREEFSNFGIADIQADHSPDRIRLNVTQIRQHGGLAFESRHRHRNGELRDVRVSARLINVRQHDYIAAVWGDITESKRASEKIREQAGMLNLAHDAITIRDLDHRITYWNRSAERIYGWTDAEAVGQFIHQLLKLDPNKIAEAHRLLLENGYWTGEFTAHAKDGREVLIESSWTLVRDAAGRPKATLAFSVDITDQRKLEQQVARNQRIESLGTLSSGIAHDLNNILTPIMVSIGMLKEQAQDPMLAKLIASLDSSAQRGAQLVKQILTFGRGVKGERIPIGLRIIVREIESLVRETFPKTIQFESGAPASLWPVVGDPTQIHQVLLNLAINARDAMPNGGKLTLTLENVVIDAATAALNSEIRPGSYVRIQVADTGTGMAPKVIERVFEPFFTTKPTGQGTGLGLSTSLGIVKSHGGFINVYSEPGKGSTFKVYFPARATGEFTETAPANEDSLPRGRGEIILLVDDEEAICTTVKKILERFGYRVITAANGAEAVSLYAGRGAEIAVVITDMHMPIMDGPATIVALKSMNPAVKIIGSSGLAANGGVAKAASSGVRHFVPKPYSAEKMLRTLREVLDNDGKENGNDPVL